jgi:CheY-like chemotaxis protein
MGRLLAKAGYDPVLVGGAVEAMERLEAGPVDAVILDIMMPVRSGIEVLEHMRWNPKLSRLPVVVLSAAFLSDEEREFVNEFAVAFVDKTAITDVLRHLRGIFATDQEASGPGDG